MDRPAAIVSKSWVDCCRCMLDNSVRRIVGTGRRPFATLKLPSKGSCSGSAPNVLPPINHSLREQGWVPSLREKEFRALP